MVGSERRTCFETQCVMALQGHPRSLILASVESACATSYWSSVVTLVLSCSVSEILQVSWEQRPHPYSTRIYGVSLEIADVVAPRSEDPKLFIPANNFELHIVVLCLCLWSRLLSPMWCICVRHYTPNVLTFPVGDRNALLNLSCVRQSTPQRRVTFVQ